MFMEDINQYLIDVFNLQKLKFEQFDFIFCNIKIDTHKYFQPSQGLSIKSEEMGVASPTYCTYTMFPSNDSNASPVLVNVPSPGLFSNKGAMSPNCSRTLRSTFVSQEIAVIDSASKVPKLQKISIKKRVGPKLIKTRAHRNRISLMSCLKRLC